MKNSVERRVDELGRIVLPKEMRNRLDIHTGDALEILVTKDGILLQKALKPAENA